jgi:glutathionylspermidine synthase
MNIYETFCWENYSNIDIEITISQIMNQNDVQYIEPNNYKILINEGKN